MKWLEDHHRKAIMAIIVIILLLGTTAAALAATPTNPQADIKPPEATAEDSFAGYCSAVDLDNDISYYEYEWTIDGERQGIQTTPEGEYSVEQSTPNRVDPYNFLQASQQYSPVRWGVSSCAWKNSGWGPCDDWPLANDDDWNTAVRVGGTSTFPHYYYEFDKPTGALTTSEFEIKWSTNQAGVQRQRFNIPSSCWNAYPDFVRFKVAGTFRGNLADGFYEGIIQCDTGGGKPTNLQETIPGTNIIQNYYDIYPSTPGWNTLWEQRTGQSGDFRLYESSMHWDFNAYPSGAERIIDVITASENDFGETWEFACRAYDGSAYTQWARDTIELPACETEYVCDSYAACDTSNRRTCNLATNTCGQTLTGTAAFEETGSSQSCDYCRPNWVCTGYGACEPNGTQTCNQVDDTNNCFEQTGIPGDATFSRGFDTFEKLSCTYVPPEEEPSNDGSSGAGTGEGTGSGTGSGTGNGGESTPEADEPWYQPILDIINPPQDSGTGTDSGTGEGGSGTGEGTGDSQTPSQEPTSQPSTGDSGSGESTTGGTESGESSTSTNTPFLPPVTYTPTEPTTTEETSQTGDFSDGTSEGTGTGDEAGETTGDGSGTGSGSGGDGTGSGSGTGSETPTLPEAETSFNQEVIITFQEIYQAVTGIFIPETPTGNVVVETITVPEGTTIGSGEPGFFTATYTGIVTYLQGAYTSYVNYWSGLFGGAFGGGGGGFFGGGTATDTPTTIIDEGETTLLTPEEREALEEREVILTPIEEQVVLRFDILFQKLFSGEIFREPVETFTNYWIEIIMTITGLGLLIWAGAETNNRRKKK